MFLLILVFVAYIGLGSFRRAYDTRAFGSIYAELASRMIEDQARRGISVSQLVARSSLSRELVEFFEHHFPAMLSFCFSVFGTLVMIEYYDILLAVICAVFFLPAGAISFLTFRTSGDLNACLNNQLEQETLVISSGKSDAIRAHYSKLRSWRVKLSDCDAVGFGLMEFLMLTLLVVALFRFCYFKHDTDVGVIVAIVRYIIIFGDGLALAPVLTLEVSRIWDVSRRVVIPPIAED